MLRSEFERAAKILAEVSDPLPRLFEKYVAVDPPPPKDTKDKSKQNRAASKKSTSAAA